MATVDFRNSLRNDEPRQRHALRATVKTAMPGGVTWADGDTLQIGVIPAGAYVTNVYANVKTATATATQTADLSIGSTLVLDDFNISATGITASTVTDVADPDLFTTSQVVTLTPAQNDVEIEVIIEYVSTATTGTFNVEQ